MAATPVETKVTAASLGALIGAALSWALDTYVFRGTTPGVVTQLVQWAAPILGALVFGWLAPHTHRPDLGAPAEPSPSPSEPAAPPGA